MVPPRGTPTQQILSFTLSTISGIIMLFFASHMAKRILAPSSMSSGQRSKVEKVLKKLNRKMPADLSEHEETVALQLVDPDDVEISFKDIGGRQQLIKEIVRVTLLPFKMAEIAPQSNLISPSKGVLLYGPPGTGKTMLARAVAKESGFVFFNLNFSQVLNKYVGESEKLISAVFSLAEKLAPSLIFIDEIDCYFKVRSMADHEFTGQMKAQFMSHWDGFQKKGHIMVMAASNRPDVIDPAILRRLPCKFEVGLPDKSQRTDIVRVILKGENVAPDIDVDLVATITSGFSGDDLREMCKSAALNAMMPIQGNEDMNEPFKPRPITTQDLLFAATRILPTGKTVANLSEYHSGVQDDDDDEDEEEGEQGRK